MTSRNEPSLTAPTTNQLNAYHTKLDLEHATSGLHYRTGRRRGQQLADRTPNGIAGREKYLTEQSKIRRLKRAANP